MTKNIETTLSYSDWARREYRTVRRTKLEELMTALYETRQFVNANSTGLKWTVKGSPKSEINAPVQKVMMLSRLYFPELASAAEVLFGSHQTIAMWGIQTERKLTQADVEIELAGKSTLPDRIGESMDAKRKIEDESGNLFITFLYPPFMAAIDQIETIASVLMNSALTIDPPVA